MYECVVTDIMVAFLNYLLRAMRNVSLVTRASLLTLPLRRKRTGITESSTDPPAVPPANLVGDAFGKRRSVDRCGGGSVTAGTTGCGWVG